MSDMDKRNQFEQEQVELYRRQKAEAFKLNIGAAESATDTTKTFERVSENEPAPTVQNNSSNEITSFSNESTRAQIERDSKKALKAEKREAKKVRQIKSGRNKKVYRMAWLLLVIILSAVTSELFITGFNDLFAVHRTDSETVTVIVSKGDDADDIAKNLEGKGVVDSAMFFSMFLTLTGKDDEIEPGVYEVDTNKDYLGIVNFLRNQDNRNTVIELQFTEGMSVLEVADKLYESGVTTDKEKFLQLCNSDEFDEEYKFLASVEDKEERVYKLEGYLFPDTYEFYVDEAPTLTISRFLDAFEAKVLEEKYEIPGYSEKITLKDYIAREGKSLDDIINTASIIQGEAANVEDMYNVSSVIKNRLERGASMDIHSLGMDSTQYYPYGSYEEIPEDIRETFESDYETYNSEGLPPGAICSPGFYAVDAAVNPNATNYFYFCHGTGADGESTSYYATSLYEHQANLVAAGLN